MNANERECRADVESETSGAASFLKVNAVRCKVIEAYSSQYPDPICFEVDAVVHVGREDPEFPGWFWCRAPSGKEGWVHRSFLAASTGTTRSTHAYSAHELTVTSGESGTLIQSLEAWAFLRLDSGEEGWIPASHVDASAA